MVSKLKMAEQSATSSSDDEYEMSDLEEKDAKPEVKKPVVNDVKAETKAVTVPQKTFFTKDNAGSNKRLIVVLDNL